MKDSDQVPSFVNLIPNSYGECGMRQSCNFPMESHELCIIILVGIHFLLLLMGMN